MNRDWLRDAVDSFKCEVLNEAFPDRGRTLNAIPMRTDEHGWEPADWQLFSSIVFGDGACVDRILLRDLRFEHDTRTVYFDLAIGVLPRGGDLFLDPDTGFETPWGNAEAQHVSIAEVGRLLGPSSDRVVAIYQHQFRRAPDNPNLEGIAYLENILSRLADANVGPGRVGVWGGAVSMIFIGPHDRIDGIRRTLLAFTGTTSARRVRSS